MPHIHIYTIPTKCEFVEREKARAFGKCCVGAKNIPNASAVRPFELFLSVGISNNNNINKNDVEYVYVMLARVRRGFLQR